MFYSAGGRDLSLLVFIYLLMTLFATWAKRWLCNIYWLFNIIKCLIWLSKAIFINSTFKTRVATSITGSRWYWYFQITCCQVNLIYKLLVFDPSKWRRSTWLRSMCFKSNFKFLIPIQRNSHVIRHSMYASWSVHLELYTFHLCRGCWSIRLSILHHSIFILCQLCIGSFLFILMLC